ALRRHMLPDSWFRVALHPLGLGLLLAGLLLAGDCLLLALAGARIGLRALAVHRESPAVPDPLVAADLDLAPDVRLDLTAQVAFGLVAGVNPVAQLHQVVFAQVADPGVAANAGRLERLGGATAANTVDVCERHLKPLLSR